MDYSMKMPDSKFIARFPYVAPTVKNEKNIRLILLPLGAFWILVAGAIFFIFRKIPKTIERHSIASSDEDPKERSLLPGEKMYAMNASNY
jgi:hypothetical protein